MVLINLEQEKMQIKQVWKQTFWPNIILNYGRYKIDSANKFPPWHGLLFLTIFVI